MLLVVGDLVEDVVAHVAEPIRLGSDAAATVTRQRGGSAANVAAFAAAAGVPVRFAGCVGEDAAGDGAVADLATTGVEVQVQRRGRTGTIVVVVDGSGERTMLPDRGACAQLRPVEEAWLDGAELLHVPLYGMDSGTTPYALRDLASRVRAAGGRVCVDASSVRLTEVHGPEIIRAWIEELRPTWVSANADEVVALGLDDPGWLAENPGLTLLARAGAQPTRVLRHGVNPLVVPVDPVADVTDTTGAGDAFAAGFLGAVLQGAGTLDAVRSGHHLAARAIRSTGATLSPLLPEG